MKGRFVIGVDLGGTKISTALVNLSGKIIYHKILPTNVERGEKYSDSPCKRYDEKLRIEH